VPAPLAYHRCVIKFFGFSSSWPAAPVPNSYWVEPGRFLAGEYPGSPFGGEQERLRALLDAGFDSFIDLTGLDELPPYDAELAGRAVHRRFPIVDHGVPESPATMRAVVEAITADLGAGRRVYLHCRAGIGRTGMAVGCYLIYGGLDGPRALEKLQTLWRRCSRARSWPSVPETEEQVEFVLQWSPDATEPVSVTDRARAALLGLAIGEALAIVATERQLEPSAWLADARNLNGLETGADTAMTLAAAESLLERQGHDARDQLQRYLAWTQQPGVAARVPPELKRVLAVWQWSRKPNPGSHDPRNVDTHTLARSLAAALFECKDVARAVELAAELSRTTLQSPLVLDTCRIWTATLIAALTGETKDQVISMHAAKTALRERQLKAQVAALLAGKWQSGEAPNGAIELLASALDVFRFTHSFEGALREAVKLGTSAGALVGSLAGAFYGSAAIPLEWRNALGQREHLETLAARLVA
jgi:ADP-ribosylglycohydrolase